MVLQKVFFCRNAKIMAAVNTVKNRHTDIIPKTAMPPISLITF
jgi:hypothetical protein